MSIVDFWRGSKLTPRFSLFSTLDSGVSDFERVFEEMSRLMEPLRTPETPYSPVCDINETDNAYVFTLDVPGLKKEDLSIETFGSQIVISGERKLENENKVGRSHRVERRYGQFRRAFTLPADIESDEVEANYNNGVLMVVALKPKAVKPTKIEVKTNPGKLTEKIFTKFEGHHKAAEITEKAKTIEA